MSFVGIADGQGNRVSLSITGFMPIITMRAATSTATSVSTGTILNAPGLLYGYMGTTAGGINFSLNGQPIGATTVSANVAVMFPAPIKFNSLSASASLGICTVFYRAL